MRTTEVELLSVEDLVSQGYKEGDEFYYIGVLKYPTKKFSKKYEHLLGKKLKLSRVEDRYAYVQYLGEETAVPLTLVKTEIVPFQVQKIICRDRVAKFNGYSFEFPCELQNASIEDARRIAKWALEVSEGQSNESVQA